MEGDGIGRISPLDRVPPATSGKPKGEKRRREKREPARRPEPDVPEAPEADREEPAEDAGDEKKGTRLDVRV